MTAARFGRFSVVVALRMVLDTGLVCPAPQPVCGVFVCEYSRLTRSAGFLFSSFTTVAWIYSLYFKEVLQTLDSGSESSESGFLVPERHGVRSNSAT